MPKILVLAFIGFIVLGTFIGGVVLLADRSEVQVSPLDEGIEEEEEFIFEDGVVCTMIYDPVCGVDGQTYGNRCIAEEQEGVEVAYEGECRKEEGDPVPTPSPTGAATPAPTPTATPTPAPTSVEVELDADDYGFYPSSEVRVPQGAAVRLTFHVDEENVYYGGLDFRSPHFTTAPIVPGESVTVEFVAEESFVFNSWWPASGVKKADGNVIVE